MGDTLMATPPAAAPARQGSAPAAGREFDALEFLAAAYLLLPLLIFQLGWLRWQYALPLSVGLLPALYRTWTARRRGAAALSRAEWLGVAGVSIAWISLSGLTPGFLLNLDWLTRMSVLRDLVIGNWPVGYSLPGGELILRCPLGYYMVPALVGKLTSLHGARVALWIWTALGSALFLALMLGANAKRRPGAWRSALLIAVFFSGMDIVGWMFSRHVGLEFGTHIEWWAERFMEGSQIQYSSQTTQLFWVPNHGLPGWLLAAIAWRHRRSGMAVVAAALLLLGTVFWAPLVAVGAAPLLLWCVWRAQGWRPLALNSLHPSVLALLPSGVLVARFLTMGVAPVSAGHAPALANATVFIVLEFGLLAWTVLACGERAPLLLLALLELVLLPFLYYGPANDLVMRASIPGLVILMMATIETWQNTLPKRRHAITLLLAIGAVTPLLELERAFTSGPRYLHEQANFIDVSGSAVWHYLSPVNRPDVKAALKPAVPLPGAPEQRKAQP